MATTNLVVNSFDHSGVRNCDQTQWIGFWLSRMMVLCERFLAGFSPRKDMRSMSSQLTRLIFRICFVKDHLRSDPRSTVRRIFWGAISLQKDRKFNSEALPCNS